MRYVPWIVLFVGGGLLFYACRTLAADAKSGYDISMGGAHLFTSAWFLGSIAAAAGLIMLFDISWWWGVAASFALFLLKSLPYRLIVAAYLGAEAPPPPRDGFKEFIRRTEGKDRT